MWLRPQVPGRRITAVAAILQLEEVFPTHLGAQRRTENSVLRLPEKSVLVVVVTRRERRITGSNYVDEIGSGQKK